MSSEKPKKHIMSTGRIPLNQLINIHLELKKKKSINLKQTLCQYNNYEDDQISSVNLLKNFSLSLYNI